VQKCISSLGNVLTKIFNSILISAPPYKDIKIKQHSEPWITSDILDNIRKRDMYLLSYKISGSKHLYVNYCKMCNLVQREIKKKAKQ